MHPNLIEMLSSVWRAVQSSNPQKKNGENSISPNTANVKWNIRMTHTCSHTIHRRALHVAKGKGDNFLLEFMQAFSIWYYIYEVVRRLLE